MCVISLAHGPSRVLKYSFWPGAILEDILDNDAVYVRRLCRAKKGIEKIIYIFFYINIVFLKLAN